jgi:uncharacterized protein (TIGR00255 family)
LEVELLLHSMTGYGRATAREGALSVEVSIRTVNNRYSQFSIRLSSALQWLEPEIRARLSRVIRRGRCDLHAVLSTEPGMGGRLVVDHDLAAQYERVIRDLSVRFGLDASHGVIELLRLPEVVRLEPADAEESLLEHLTFEALETALAELVAFREREGAALAEDIAARLDGLRSARAELERIAESQVERVRERLRRRLAALLEGEGLDPARFEQEVAMLADRADITEELVRIASHLEGFGVLLHAGGAVGRRMDFVAQELQREINTIASKLGDVQALAPVLEFRSELERIREQVQNVE